MFTRRGWTVAGVAALAFVLAALHGARSLNAVVVPALIALGAALFQVRRADQPSVERLLPDEAFVGGDGVVELEVRTGSPVAARVEDGVPSGVTAVGAQRETTVHETALSYDVQYVARGDQAFGPLVVTVYDVLGLARRQFRYDDRDVLLVYPWVADLRGSARHALNLLPDVSLERRREEFEGLREYEPGDPLRDVNWKASAKQASGDIVVTEFVAEEEEGSVTMAVGANRSGVDAAATAAASVALYLVDAGIAVALAAPNGTIPAATGDTQRERLLDLLARMPEGSPPEDAADAADLVVHGERDPTEAAVTVGGREMSFEDLTGGEVRPPTPDRSVGGLRSRLQGVAGVVP